MNSTGQSDFLLPRTQLIRTCDLRRLRRVISREAEPIRYSLRGADQTSYVEVTKLELSTSKLFGLHFDASLEAEIAPTQNFEFYFVGAGNLTVLNQESQCTVHVGEGVVYFPGDIAVHRWEPGSEALALFLEKRLLETLVTGFYRLDARLLSGRIIPLSYASGLYRSIFNLIMQISMETEQAGRCSRELDGGLEQLLHSSCALLIEQILNQRHASLGIQQAPRYLKRSVDYIVEHLADDIKLADLSELSQVSPRTIQYAFHKYFNQSPTEFICHTKLSRVREELLKANPKDMTVTKIAAQWGFFHASNFARSYSALFGEYPSDTLHSSRPNLNLSKVVV
ncbi:MAG: helix-turn-helix domain-containing protein [Halioglobus sp.]|nr:helix-turn-helix domain-containing protein [Halioglobus sp.]